MITVKTNAPGLQPVAGKLVLIATVKESLGANRVEVIHTGECYDHSDLRDLHAVVLSEGVAEIIRMTLDECPDLTVDQAYLHVMGHIQDILNTRLDELRKEYSDAGQ